MSDTKLPAKRGPKTVRGKIAVATNPIKHGILSPKPVVSTLESETAWQRHRDSILSAIDPQNGLEQALAERVALNSWRLNRVVTYETLQLNENQDDLVDEMRRDADRYSTMRGDDKRGFEAAEEAEKLRAIEADLEGIFYERSGAIESPHTISWICDEAPYNACEYAIYQSNPRTFDEADAEEEAEEQALDLSDEFLERIRYTEDSKPSDVRDALRWLAEEAGVKDDENYTAYESVWEKLFTVARSRLSWAGGRAQDLERKIASKRRKGALPSEEEMQKIARYEAHLSREMYKAMHELEALQKRRAGEPTPLARIDVHMDED